MVAFRSSRVSHQLLLVAILLLACFQLLRPSDAIASSSSASPYTNNHRNHHKIPNRREILLAGGDVAAAALATSYLVPCAAMAQGMPEETVGMERLDTANLSAAHRGGTTTTTNPLSSLPRRQGSGSTSVIVPLDDPPPHLILPTRRGGSTTIAIPRIGYSLYKTPADQAERCTRLALRAGIHHFDVASTYGPSNLLEIAKALKQYLTGGREGLDVSTETTEVLDRLEAARVAGDQHAAAILPSSRTSSTSLLSPAPLGSAGRRGRREGLFLHYKISNQDQSNDPVAVRRAVKRALADLGCMYLDMVSIHSPLTDQSRRLTTYQALLDLQDSGFIKSVGVCNYGVAPLQEISDAGLDLPLVNQLELSPFNTHSEVVDWCHQNGVAISCSAWSRLSGADGPTQGWDVLAKLAQEKGMTKAQVLVRWALQKGYLCVPRSSSASKVERIAIAENSYGGVNPPPVVGGSSSSFVLTPEEMRLLDSLNVSYPAGKLGRRDGWSDEDVTGVEWDPTTSMV